MQEEQSPQQDFMNVSFGSYIESLYRYPSTRILLASNIVPIIGVSFFGWSLPDIIASYWFDTLFIGLFSAVKMRYAIGDAAHLGVSEEKARSLVNKENGWEIASFLFSFLFLMIVYSQVLFQIIGNILSLQTIIIMISVFFVSHLVSFFTNYLGKKEYVTATVGELRTRLFPRFGVIHMAVFMAGMFTILMPAHYHALLLYTLMIFKSFADLAQHSKDRGLRIEVTS